MSEDQAMGASVTKKVSSSNLDIENGHVQEIVDAYESGSVPMLKTEDEQVVNDYNCTRGSHPGQVPLFNSVI